MTRTSTAFAALMCWVVLCPGVEARRAGQPERPAGAGASFIGPPLAPRAIAPLPDEFPLVPPSRPRRQEEEPVPSSEQSREAMAIDSTATQWSFQLAYQQMSYKDDTVNGQPRPEGNDNFWQLRIVAPIPKSEKIPFTLLPRLTIRHYEAPTGESGFGSSELFVLGIAQDWGTGRWGIGPLVEIPGQVGNQDLGYGLAGAVVNSSTKWYYGVLLTQAWRDRDPTLDQSGAAPLGIAPFLNYQLGAGWYVGNGDMVIRYDWDSDSVYVPIGVRVGKTLIREKSSFNLYAEYQTSLIYDDWPGSAVDDSVRLNVTYTLPVGL